MRSRRRRSTQSRRKRYVVPSQNVTGQILVLDDVGQHFCHVGLVDRDVLVGKIRAFERNLVEQLLHHRVQAARADVFRALVDERREVRDLLNRSVGEDKLDALSVHEGRVLLDERTLWLGQNTDELVAAEGLELDANRKSSLQFRNQIRGFDT